MKLLVLYEELAGYFIACVSRFAEMYDAEVLVLRKAVNQVAPFTLADTPRLRMVDRDTIGKEKLADFCNEFSPDAILCGGWAYRPYLDICHSFHGKIPVVLGFDNWWEGSFRQKISAAAAKYYFRNRFSACFVPGSRQKEFALRLGFPEEKIRTGAYCCDYDFFHRIGEEKKERKEFPRRFIYSGRYVKEKGVAELWQAFTELRREFPGWELWCLGKGDVEPVEAEGIRHFGFVQPEEIGRYLVDTGVFILPSRFEPWGVVVHEFAAAGFPLLLSEKVGAAEAFLEEGRNGYLFRSEDPESMKTAMRTVMELPAEKLAAMGRHSAQLAEAHTPEKWSGALYRLIHEG